MARDRSCASLRRSRQRAGEIAGGARRRPCAARRALLGLRLTPTVVSELRGQVLWAFGFAGLVVLRESTSSLLEGVKISPAGATEVAS